MEWPYASLRRQRLPPDERAIGVAERAQFGDHHFGKAAVEAASAGLGHRIGGAMGKCGNGLLGAFVGSEGCFGIALDVTVRLQPDPQAVRTLLADFASVGAAATAVSAVIASGILPAAMELMDGPTIRAVEASVYAAGYPTDAAAVLLIEVDGLARGLEADVAVIGRLGMDGHVVRASLGVRRRRRRAPSRRPNTADSLPPGLRYSP